MLQKSSMWRTLEIFFLYPTREHYLMDISRKINLAHTSVKKNLDKLVKLSIIKETVKKQGERKFPIYEAAINSRNYKKYKLIYNLSSILESGLIDFIEQKLMPRSIILFGSYQKGEDAEESDIDLFVECKEEKIEIGKFEKILKRKIQLHFNENFSMYTKELKNNIINGITLAGFLEGYK